jgi:uncharacterized membrane protein YccC
MIDNWTTTRTALGSAARFSLRMTASALVAFALVQVMSVPLHGLWAVLTAVVVTQASTGGSIRATFEYLLGTLLGALYATLVALVVPHTTLPMMGLALALAIIPLAFAAASSAVFRVAPFTAVIVLLLGNEFGQGPIPAAATRFLEVALGGAIAVAVSLLVLPERANRRSRRLAVAAMEQLAAALPFVLNGLSERADPARINDLQVKLGATVASLDATVAEAKHEHAVSLGGGADAGPLSRTLLRLRHDLVIVGRAAAEPLPAAIAQRVAPLASAFGAEVSRYLDSCAHMSGDRDQPLALGPVNIAIDAFTSEIAAMREEGLTRPLSTSQVEQLFALGFAFEEVRRNLSDLQRSVRDWSNS